MSATDRFTDLWRSLSDLGRDERTGGYRRLAWTPADLACRRWFAGTARDRGLEVETDRNGNLWAWWGSPGRAGAVVTGSHLDSVPHGGAYDGPLGIVSAFLAIDELRTRGVSPGRPIAVAAFTEEEGARFGLACLGSRLLTGAASAARARELRDADGVTLAEAMAAAGGDPLGLGADPERLSRIATFVELHIEQGRALATLDASVGVAGSIWPHGRWRLEFGGEANHAGTTRMEDRRDPVLTFAHAVVAANEQARRAGGTATVGRAAIEPNATNAIAGRVTAWLDARAANQSTLDQMVAAIGAAATDRARADGTTFTLAPESITGEVRFDEPLRDRIAALLAAPVLPTGAGHDAGVLATAGVPTVMLFVRNPTGVSHAPAEHATDADCASGVTALAAVLEELACR